MSQTTSQIEEFNRIFDAHKNEIQDNFFTFLKFESIGAEPEYTEQTRSCAEWLCTYLSNVGLTSEIIQTPGHPLVFAEWNKAGSNAPTLLIYGHYDVQPVDPIELWTSPPFIPTIKDGNVYARGAQDDKGQIFYTISAIASLLKEKKTLPVNIKMCIEGEEENGSAGFQSVLSSLSDKLKADYLVVVDIGFNSISRPTVTVGTRGLVAMSLEVVGSNTDLHSGSHGGVAFNPNHALIQMLNSIRNVDGKITIKGFYDDVVVPNKSEFAKFDCSFDEVEYEQFTGAKPVGGEKEFSPFESKCTRPTVEINGISGGYAGNGFKTVIPSRACAKISARLVPNQDPDKIANLISEHLISQAPNGISANVTIHKGTGKPLRTSTDSKIVKAASQAFADVTGEHCRLALHGASIPISPSLAAASGAELVLIGYGLPSDMIHAPNENFGLDRFKMGFVTICRLLDLISQVE